MFYLRFSSTFSTRGDNQHKHSAAVTQVTGWALTDPCIPGPCMARVAVAPITGATLGTRTYNDPRHGPKTPAIWACSR